MVCAVCGQAASATCKARCVKHEAAMDKRMRYLNRLSTELVDLYVKGAITRRELTASFYEGMTKCDTSQRMS